MNKRWINTAEQGLFALGGFILVFLLFHNKIDVPLWMQPIGRLHPLLLHFPIVILLLGVGMDLFRFQPAGRATDVYCALARMLLLVGTLTAGLTVVMGLFLAREDGYTGNALFWHKWTGVGIFFVSATLYWAHTQPWYRVRTARFGGLVLAVFLVGAGHYGATVTHGDNFLFAPISRLQKPETVPLEQAVVFTDVIQPIFEQKCVSCHNPDKLKGELALTDAESVRRGGKTGKLVVPGKPELSLLLQRIHLPADEKKHMPPSGKSQLTPLEISLLNAWVKGRATVHQKLINLPQTDSLRLLATALFKPAQPAEVYAFDPADDETIRKLNTDFRTIVPLARESPALAVNLYNRAAYSPQQLAELSPINQQVVSLNLNKLPVQDQDIDQITQFGNLRKLVLNFTDITGKSLSSLADLTALTTLSLSGTRVNFADLRAKIGAFKSLKTLTVWNTPLTPAQVAQLQKAHPGIAFVTGFNSAKSNPIKLNPPQVKNSSTIFSQSLQLNIQHPVRGVELRYTTDGSEPDSLHVRVLTSQTVIDQSAAIRVKAFKAGWYSSDVTTFHFYKSTYKPDSVRLLLPLNPVHQANGAHTFFDGTLGTFNANSPAWANNWAGFRNNDMVLLSEFKQPVTLSSVALRIMEEEETGIFPPGTVDVWGGPRWDQLKKLTTITPGMPYLKSPHALKTVTGTFSPQAVSCLKIVARPLKQLPAWHPNKGKPGLLLVDEIFLN